MPISAKYGLVALLFILMPTGCQQYQSRPLIPAQVMDFVTEERQALDAMHDQSDPREFTFPRAAELVSRCSPALKETRAEYATALALAKVPTPRANPTLDLGPQVGFGPDIGKASPLAPLASLSFSIPLGGKRKRQDELNQVTAALAMVEAAVKHRELFLELRLFYTRLVLSRARIEIREKTLELAGKAVEIAKQAVSKGVGTRLDGALPELEQLRLKTELLTFLGEKLEVERQLSRLIGVQAAHFQHLPDSALPDLPAAVPSREALESNLLANHPGLARLRARYEVAERELHLEIARQYPDFFIGPSYERETGERKNILGLTLGIEIPVFNKNQQAIATAKAKREETRAKYEAAANLALADLDGAIQIYALAAEKLKFVKDALLPKAQENVELARKSLDAGATDVLRYLEAERGLRQAMLESVEADVAIREALVEIERTVGYPIVQFPGEQREDRPTLPQRIEEPTQ